MCQYRVTTFRCGHTRKLPIAPCYSRPGCSEVHDLAELSHDLSDVRAAIRTCNLSQDNHPSYQELIGKIHRNYGSFFGHGSANGDRVHDSLRQLERYLVDEIAGVATNVTVRDWSDGYCLDSCWEAVIAMGREEQLRRGRLHGSYGG